MGRYPASHAGIGTVVWCYLASHAGIGTVLSPLRGGGGGAVSDHTQKPHIWVAVVTGSRSTARRQP